MAGTARSEEAIAELRVTRDDVRKWHRRGWISFDIDSQQELDTPREWEVQFIRSLVVSGLADVQIDQLLEPLAKPYRFDPRYVAYHFEYGWVEPVGENPYDVIEENLADWINELGAKGDVERLQELASQVEEQINQIEETD